MPRHKHVTNCLKSGGAISKYCTCQHCTLCVCSVCGAYEGGLTTDCPGEDVHFDRQKEVHETNLDYTDERGWHQGEPMKRRVPRFEPATHKPRLIHERFAEDYVSTRITGCLCGWRVPQDIVDAADASTSRAASDAFAAHVAMTAVTDKLTYAELSKDPPRHLATTAEPATHAPRVTGLPIGDGAVEGPRIVGCSCGWKVPAGVQNSDDAFMQHAAQCGDLILGHVGLRARLETSTPTPDWAADRRISLQYELVGRAIEWVLADRLADDHSATLTKLQDEAKVFGDRPDRDLLAKLERAKSAFKKHDQVAQKCDEVFRDAAKRLVEELEKK